MLDSLPESRGMTGDGGVPTFLARKGVMVRHYHVVVVWPDGRREKIGQFLRRPDAARWIVQESAEWLAQHFARAADMRAGSCPIADGASPSPT